MIRSQPPLSLPVHPLPRGQGLCVLRRLLRVQPSSPQFRNQQLDHILKSPRRRHMADVEPVQIRLHDPPLHLVRHRRRAANRHGAQPTDRRLLRHHPRRPARDVLARGRERVQDTHDPARLCRVGRRDLLVQRDPRDVDACPSAEEDEPPNHGRVLLQLLVLGPGLLVRAAQDGCECRKDLDRPWIPPLLRCQLADPVDFGPQHRW
ncbi:hypothetical protein CNMCM8812_008097 [Aspergillus fumigatus]|nr:hypothetical protein CNMCM8812_008097 [Aspergillus fumigatus]